MNLGTLLWDAIIPSRILTTKPNACICVSLNCIFHEFLEVPSYKYNSDTQAHAHNPPEINKEMALTGRWLLPPSHLLLLHPRTAPLATISHHLCVRGAASCVNSSYFRHSGASVFPHGETVGYHCLPAYQGGSVEPRISHSQAPGGTENFQAPGGAALSLSGKLTSMSDSPTRSRSLSRRIWGRTGRKPVHSPTILAFWKTKCW